MKVNNNSAKGVNAGTVSGTNLEKTLATKNNAKAGKADAAMGSTKVDMSPEAQAFQKAKGIASKETVDEAKVARLQKLIDEGKYKVDAKAVADKLVDEQIAMGE